MMATAAAPCRPHLAYSAGFDLVALGPGDCERLAAHYRSVRALRVSVGSGTLGELCNLPQYAGTIDLEADGVIAACDPGGGIIATARVHRTSRFFSWAELWYTAWPGARACGACGQATARAIEWAQRRGYACLVAYAGDESSSERAMLERLDFQVHWQHNELIAEIDLDRLKGRPSGSPPAPGAGGRA
jgi:hypothetical protein